MPVTQLRGYDSADLTDPRRQGLELHRAVPAWVTDHGCDSPTEEVRKNTKYGSSRVLEENGRLLTWPAGWFAALSPVNPE
ncbi:hypothetical protein GCM10022233_36520 [Streptomyces shaanxiensis]|uniref:Uncharacterized protein n=1 Tax=Streptomyces shaanxiensis TaxID=653357 RepID=A0ABP7V6A1_9ACTN